MEGSSGFRDRIDVIGLLSRFSGIRFSFLYRYFFSDWRGFCFASGRRWLAGGRARVRYVFISRCSMYRYCMWSSSDVKRILRCLVMGVVYVRSGRQPSDDIKTYI